MGSRAFEGGGVGIAQIHAPTELARGIREMVADRAGANDFNPHEMSDRAY
jgi:hypothetical protein